MTKLLFHINSLLNGSIEKVLLELLRRLSPTKYKIQLSITHDFEDMEILRSQIPAHVEVHHILDAKQSLTKKKKINGTITFSERIYEEIIMPVIKKRMHKIRLSELIKNADVVIDFDMTLAAYTNLFRNKKKIAFCHFNLGHYWDGNKRKLNKLARRLKRYDKVVMKCDEMKEKEAELYPSLQGHLVRIYNSIDSEKILTLSLYPLVGHEYLLEDGYLVSVGRLAEDQKDFTTVIKGYAACAKKYGIKERLVIVGSGHSSPTLEELAINEEVGEMVMFVGNQANPYNWMSNSKMFLFCSKYEGLPMVLVEALSVACPIIATATPTGVREVLMNGRAGILIAPGDQEALAESIYKLLNDAALRQSFRENAKEILCQFEIKRMVSEFERLVSD